ncbi:MAG: dolichol kinase [Haloarculaceae archaeon]
MADEVARRLVHASGSAIPLSYVLGLAPWHQVRLVLLAGAAVTVVLEFVRLVVGVEWVVFETLTREYEQSNPAGYALYVVSGSLTGLAFAPRVAVPAILMLTLADPISGLLGSDELRTVKRPRVLAVMFGTCALLAWSFVPPAVAVVGGLAGMLADGVKPVIAGYVIDDNFTIPLGAAAAMAAGLAVLAGV